MFDAYLFIQTAFAPHSADPDLDHSPRHLQLRTSNAFYAQL